MTVPRQNARRQCMNATVTECDVVEKRGDSLGDYRFDFVNMLHIMHVIRIQVSSSPRY